MVVHVKPAFCRTAAASPSLEIGYAQLGSAVQLQSCWGLFVYGIILSLDCFISSRGRRVCERAVLSTMFIWWLGLLSDRESGESCIEQSYKERAYDHLVLLLLAWDGARKTKRFTLATMGHLRSHVWFSGRFLRVLDFRLRCPQPSPAASRWVKAFAADAAFAATTVKTLPALVRYGRDVIPREVV